MQWKERKKGEKRRRKGGGKSKKVREGDGKDLKILGLREGKVSPVSLGVREGSPVEEPG